MDWEGGAKKSLKIAIFRGSKAKIFGTYTEIREEIFGADDKGKYNLERFLKSCKIYQNMLGLTSYKIM